jgi:hypothetical protein
VKLVEISGTKQKEHSKVYINELETNSKVKNIGYLYRGVNEYKVTNLELSTG